MKKKKVNESIIMLSDAAASGSARRDKLLPAQGPICYAYWLAIYYAPVSMLSQTGTRRRGRTVKGRGDERHPGIIPVATGALPGIPVLHSSLPMTGINILWSGVSIALPWRPKEYIAPKQSWRKTAIHEEIWPTEMHIGVELPVVTVLHRLFIDDNAG